MRWQRGGASGRIVCGDKGLVSGCVCGRGFCGYIFVKGVLLGYLNGILWGD